MRRVIFLALVALAIGNTSQAAQIYKWVDAQGVTHFDAQPPAGQASQEINVAKPPPAPAPATPAIDTDAQSQQRTIDAQVKKQVAADEARRIESCTSLRTNLAKLQNNPRVREQFEGGLRRLSEDERQARIVETQKAIKDICD